MKIRKEIEILYLKKAFLDLGIHKKNCIFTSFCVYNLPRYRYHAIAIAIKLSLSLSLLSLSLL